jgi:nucleoside-diphosphate-sugar epimerase
MNILFIGGTGNISAACVRRALDEGHAVSVLNRGSRDIDAYIGRPGAVSLIADIHDEQAAAHVLNNRVFDVVANFIAFTPEDVERDIRLFSERCGQYVFISSASVYEKPPGTPFITESHPLRNPYWAYSRDKIACEAVCTQAYRERGFPAVIVRPSLTYQTVIPLALGGWDDYGIIKRMRAGKPIIVHGDGTSLWTVTHSEDFARGFNGLLGQPSTHGHAFHITSDEVLTWNDIHEAVAAAAGVEPHLVHIPSDFIIAAAKAAGQGWLEGSLLGDKAASVIFDNTKIKRFVPGFQARIPFREGIRRTIAWFEADAARRKVDPAGDVFLDGILSAYQKGLDAIS